MRKLTEEPCLQDEHVEEVGLREVCVRVSVCEVYVCACVGEVCVRELTEEPCLQEEHVEEVSLREVCVRVSVCEV